MKMPVFYIAGRSPALLYAKEALQEKDICFAQQPDASVTHLLLGVPSFTPEGTLRGGGSLEDFLPLLNKDVQIVGGNLQHPALADYSTLDLLQDPFYVAENADITAHCALQVAQRYMPMIWKGCPVLVIGWGRIGKCLTKLLHALGAQVSIGLRNMADRALLTALGYDTLDSQTLGYELLRYRVIFNTVPATVLSRQSAEYCRPDCLKIELSSAVGIDCPDTIFARGLPGQEAPETSGKLIARTILHRYQEGVSQCISVLP